MGRVCTNPVLASGTCLRWRINHNSSPSPVSNNSAMMRMSASRMRTGMSENWPMRSPREPGERFKLLFVGGDYMRKGGDTLVEAFDTYLRDTCELHVATQGNWIPEEQREEAIVSGYTVVDLSSVMATHLTEVIRRNLHEIFNRQDFIERSRFLNIRNGRPATGSTATTAGPSSTTSRRPPTPTAWPRPKCAPCWKAVAFPAWRPAAIKPPAWS